MYNGFHKNIKQNNCSQHNKTNLALVRKIGFFSLRESFHNTKKKNLTDPKLLNSSLYIQYLNIYV